MKSLSFKDGLKGVFSKTVMLSSVAALMLAAGTAQLSAAEEDKAALAEVGNVPVVIGDPEGAHGNAPTIDTSNIENNAPEPLSEGRRDMIRHQDQLQRAPILSLAVEGNSEIVPEHILSVVSSKVGMPMDQNRLRRDADEIFELGFFSEVDYRIVDEADGAHVIFMVRENPIIGEINFFGNETYTADQLRKICFTQTGMIFNRVFFRNDLQRIKEKYQQDGYVMARVSDVRIEGTNVNVYLTEPTIHDIIIQGNRRTKTYVIERQLKVKAGDKFNATRLRYTLSRLQGMGYFEDVNVGFESGETPDALTLILTVTEARTGRIGISVGYGSQSGLSGGLSYSDNNWGGRGQRFGVGFDIGRRKQLWLNLEQPYMDEKVFAWRVGVYRRAWEDLSYYDKNEYQFDYDEDRIGGYIGFGRKFSERSKLSWYLTTEWQKVEIETKNNYVLTPEQIEQTESGKNFSVLGRLTRDNMDPYTDYPKGDVESVYVEKGLNALGGTWDYWKYWLEARFYTELNFLSRLFERNFTIDDIPPIIAARIIAGDSNGYLPWAVDYTVGGDNTLRGYKDKYYRGDQIFIGNAELRLPVHKSASLVLFYDIGRAWDKNRDASYLSDMGRAYGLGVRVRTPIGNLRLDFAQGDEESRFHFGFGEMF